MRLAFLVESIDLERGGAERAVMTMARALEARSHSCAIVAPADRTLSQASENGPRILTLPLPRLGRAKRARFLAEGLAPLARDAGYDCLVSCGKIVGAEFHWPHGGVHEATLRASCAAGRGPLHSQWARWGKRLRPVEAVFKDIEEGIYERVRKRDCQLIAISKKVQGDMTRFHGIPPEQIEICHNGAPLHLFQDLSNEQREERRRAFCETHGLNAGTKLLFFIAMNPRLKGSRTLARVMKKAPPELSLFYIGKKPKHSLGPQERFLGPRSDVPDLLEIGHGLLLPSHYDPCSLVTLEALAAGLPVITTVHNGAIELLNDKAWIIHDKESLLNALKELAQDPKQENRRKAAKDAAKAWTAQDAATRFLEIIEAH